MAPAISMPDRLHGLIPASRIEFVRELWACVKNASQLTVTGWLAEAWFIQRCKLLEVHGIRTVRGVSFTNIKIAKMSDSLTY